VYLLYCKQQGFHFQQKRNLHRGRLLQVDDVFRVFGEFKTIFSIKENQNLADTIIKIKFLF